MKKTKTNKKKWSVGKKQQSKSSKVVSHEDAILDEDKKIEENVNSNHAEAEDPETAVDEADEAPAEAEATANNTDTAAPAVSHAKNSRMSRLDELKKRMNNKKVWK